MALENVSGNLRDAYRLIIPSTMLHVDQLATERRTNHELRKLGFYTADGELYSAQFWAVTRQPQNLVLKHLDEAFTQLRTNRNYLPNSEEALVSVQHPDTVVMDLHGLKLIKDSDEYGHFVVDPRNPKELNSQQKLAAMRIFGPDEENYGKNLEMFAEAGKTPWVFVLMPDYVQNRLQQSNAEYLARASWLNYFDLSSQFSAIGRDIYDHGRARGVRRGASVSEQEAPTGRDAQKTSSPNRVQVIAEEALELKVRKVLSKFDKYVGPVNEVQYLAERYQAEKELAALLKK